MPALAPRVTPARVQAILADVPDAWLGSDSLALATPAALRAAYAAWFAARLTARAGFLEEAMHARA